jgi:hypothetical protein
MCIVLYLSSLGCFNNTDYATIVLCPTLGPSFMSLIVLHKANTAHHACFVLDVGFSFMLRFHKVNTVTMHVLLCWLFLLY